MLTHDEIEQWNDEFHKTRLLNDLEEAANSVVGEKNDSTTCSLMHTLLNNVIKKHYERYNHWYFGKWRVFVRQAPNSTTMIDTWVGDPLYLPDTVPEWVREQIENGRTV